MRNTTVLFLLFPLFCLKKSKMIEIEKRVVCRDRMIFTKRITIWDDNIYKSEAIIKMERQTNIKESTAMMHLVFNIIRNIQENSVYVNVSTKIS